MKLINKIPTHDRPREKLLARNAAALTDQELLVIILGHGTSKVPVNLMASRILALFDEQDEVTPQDLLRIEGVGPAKATQLAAVIEFVRRKVRPAGFKIRNPTDLVPLIRHYADRKQEHFICASLNGANELIATRVIAIGLVNQALIHPREVFADAITDRASAIIVAHNHPSGNVRPSQADINLTMKLEAAGQLLGIPLMDHLIFSHSDFYSLALEGHLNHEVRPGSLA